MNEAILTEACWPYKSDLVLSFDAAKDFGKEYCLFNFGIVPEVIER